MASIKVKKKSYREEVPDGGWGWMVVFGSALCNSVCQVQISQYGLVFGEHLESLGYSTEEMTLVITVLIMVLSIFGLLAAPIIKKYSYRKISIIAALLVSTGLLVCSQATCLFHVVIGFGVILGAGLGILQLTTFLVINSYFKERKSIAIGMSLAGTSIGQALMPHLVRYLLANYSFQETLTFLAGIALHGVVGALLFQPVKYHMRRKAILIEDFSKDAQTKIVMEPLLPAEKEAVVVPVHQNVVQKPKEVSQVRKNLIAIFDLQLLLDPIFLLIIVDLGLSKTVNTYFFMIFPLFLRHQFDYGMGEISSCMSSLAIADAAARLTLPHVTKKFGLSARVTFLLCMLGMELTRLGTAFRSKFLEEVILSFVLGYFRGGAIVNTNLSVAEYCPADVLPSGLGLNMLLGSFVVFLTGQLLGWIRDFSGSYFIGFLSVNICGAATIILCAIEIIIRKITSKQ